MLRPGSDIWLDIKNIQLSRTWDLEYVREITSMKYSIENYVMTKLNTKLKIELWKIKKYLIIGLEKYNIQ